MTVQATQENSHSRSEYLTAWVVYGLILGTFVTVATVAVILTSQREAQKEGFRAIETAQPISFFDKTYMKKSPSKTVPLQQH